MMMVKTKQPLNVTMLVKHAKRDNKVTVYYVKKKEIKMIIATVIKDYMKKIKFAKSVTILVVLVMDLKEINVTKI